MSRVVSLAARKAMEAGHTDEVEVVLIKITHPDLPTPIRVSSDNADVISTDPEPLFGTRSTWLTDDGSPFLLIAMGIELPDDDPEGVHESRLILEILDPEVTEALINTIVPARVDIAVVMASSPNFVEQQLLNLEMTAADGDGGFVTLSFSRQAIEEEPYPADRMTKLFFPGLHP